MGSSMARFNSCCVVAGVGCVDGVVRGVAVGRGIFSYIVTYWFPYNGKIIASSVTGIGQQQSDICILRIRALLVTKSFSVSHNFALLLILAPILRKLMQIMLMQII